ncbi:esterase/lipase family protein [Labedaea rhizosphaerae]|uniref:Lipase (Class 2) n=1 Tax=Labedaea rhizosphaerae TaxID=598644 RepID=A0A4R6SHE0_LABRH|nr:alpha/beta fold hydrolase [Labedaea rhizosphaerae]TDQ00348.1 lipase (class 2) [Labedaea rhizosphaerae]
MWYIGKRASSRPRRSRRVPAALGLTLLAVLLPLQGAVADAQSRTGPEQPGFVSAFTYSLGAPDVDPPGANDWACRPSTRHSHPVVLVHGMYENRYDNWARLAPALARDGYCVFALDYGDFDDAGVGMLPVFKGYGDLPRSATELAAFVDRVLAATGAPDVDLVAHSAGGLVARQYLAFDGGTDPSHPSTDKVDKLVTLGTPNHGTTGSGLFTLLDRLGLLAGMTPVIGAAGAQQLPQSDFITHLNAAGETRPGVDYTDIATRYDEISTPYRTAFLTAGPGASVRNVTLQDGCFLDFSDHFSMSYSPRAIGLVRRALDPASPAAPCAVNLPFE